MWTSQRAQTVEFSQVLCDTYLRSIQPSAIPDFNNLLTSKRTRAASDSRICSYLKNRVITPWPGATRHSRCEQSVQQCEICDQIDFEEILTDENGKTRQSEVYDCFIVFFSWLCRLLSDQSSRIDFVDSQSRFRQWKLLKP